MVWSEFAPILVDSALLMVAVMLVFAPGVLTYVLVRKYLR